jgi:hypothetical protein
VDQQVATAAQVGQVAQATVRRPRAGAKSVAVRRDGTDTE